MALAGDQISTETPRTWSFLRRRIAVVGLVILLALVTAGVASLWLSNTQALDVDVVYDGVAEPGETVTVQTPAGGGCAGPMRRLYRESLGRWRRTHSGEDGQVWSRDDIHWWNTTRRVEFNDLECRIGDTVSITVPEDVTWSPVVACMADDRLCVRIPVSG